jgi:uncharacterized protein involved in propanediol utilization
MLYKNMMNGNKILNGHGRSFASFGEIVQGRSGDDTDFLATLPINLWSYCDLTAIEINGPLIVEAKEGFLKSKLLVEMILKRIGIQEGYYITVEINSEIPVGKGLSSSSADMLAALRATQHLFGFLVSSEHISYLFHEIEPHDALHFDSSVLYDHRKGCLINDYKYIPEYTIIYVDTGGTIDTINYNKSINYNKEIIKNYEKIVANLNEAFINKDDSAIAMNATESFMLHIRANNDKRLEYNEFLKNISAIGVQATHSGTCVGFLFKSKTDKSILDYAENMIEKKYKKTSRIVRTLKLID